MGLVRNENVSLLQSSNVENCRKPRSENNLETLEDDLNTDTEETDVVSIVLQDSGVDKENFISVGGDFPIAAVANSIIENDVPTACHAEEIDIEHNVETGEDSPVLFLLQLKVVNLAIQKDIYLLYEIRNNSLKISEDLWIRRKSRKI